MNIFDTHFHLMPGDNLDQIIKRAAANGIKTMLVAGTTISETQSMVDRISSVGGVYAAVGVHPHEAQEFDGDMSNFHQLVQQSKVKAVGEIGLDYYYKHSPSDLQQTVFTSFLNFALETGLPTIVHCRDAFEDCYRLIDQKLRGKVPFVIHCFTGSPDWAQRFIDLGGYLSFNGILTFKKSENIRTVLKEIPLDRLLLETDSPYLAPDPCRGTKNEPANMIHIVKCAAEELGMKADDLAEITTNNALRFFNIGDINV